MDEVVTETPSAETEQTPVDPKAPAAEPKKPRTIDDDLEDVYKKHGGATFKAGGKERKAATWAETKRHLSRVAGTDEVATEALRVRQQEAERTAKLAGLGADVNQIQSDLDAQQAKMTSLQTYFEAYKTAIAAGTQPPALPAELQSGTFGISGTTLAMLAALAAAAYFWWSKEN